VSTESAFSANVRLPIAGHDVQVTVRGDSAAEFQMHWAEIAEGMQTLIESVTLTVGASNAATLVNAAPSVAPGAAPADNPWAPAQASAPPSDPWGAAAPAAPEPAGPAPICDHGQPMKLVPAGISKKTGQPYKAFYVCAAPQKAQQCGKTVRL
jgi:hypothetical protein